MKDRLLQLLTSENMTSLKFAEIMEIRPSNVSHILAGRNNPSFDFVARLLRRFPELSPDWVLNGVGDMYRIGFKHDFSGMGAEGDEPINANTANPMPVMPKSLEPILETEVAQTPEISEVQQPVAMPEMPCNSDEHLQSANINTPDRKPQAPQTIEIPRTVLDAPSQIATNSPVEPQKLVLIYSDNTFEVLTPKSR